MLASQTFLTKREREREKEKEKDRGGDRVVVESIIEEDKVNGVNDHEVGKKDVGPALEAFPDMEPAAPAADDNNSSTSNQNSNVETRKHPTRRSVSGFLNFDFFK
jgi:hypothetical protein